MRLTRPRSDLRSMDISNTLIVMLNTHETVKRLLAKCTSFYATQKGNTVVEMRKRKSSETTRQEKGDTHETMKGEMIKNKPKQAINRRVAKKECLLRV